MNEAELALIKEGLVLLDEAVTKLDSLQNNSVAHVLAKIIHTAISMGKLLLGDK